MTQEYYSIVTNYGLQKQLNCLSKIEDFDIKYISIGDGAGSLYEPNVEQTSLKNQKWKGEILTHEIKDNNLISTVSVPIDIGDFIIRELGLLDSNNNLLCVAKCPETNKHNSTLGGAQELFIKFYMSIANTDLIPLIKQESSVMASADYVKNNFATINLDNLSAKGQDKFNQKQDALIAGQGIILNKNVISCNVISFQELKTIQIDIPDKGE